MIQAHLGPRFALPLILPLLHLKFEAYIPLLTDHDHFLSLFTYLTSKSLNFQYLKIFPSFGIACHIFIQICKLIQRKQQTTDCRVFSWRFKKKIVYTLAASILFMRIQLGRPLNKLDLQLQMIPEIGWGKTPRSWPLCVLPHVSQFGSTWKPSQNMKEWGHLLFKVYFVLFLLLLPCMHTKCSAAVEEELYLQRLWSFN